MPENIGKLILENMILELERERKRFLDLISTNIIDLFGEKQEVVIAKLNMRLGAFDEQLKQVKQMADAKEHPDYVAAWQGIVKLRRDFLPQLSNEVLSVFGGLYIRKMGLDNICTVDENIQVPLSFAEQAEELIQDLLGRSIGEWHSVLIVGEEKYAHSEAEIIRLRYPACDLWNLPYTAYEYGYLIANRKPPGLFSQLREEVRKRVKPNDMAGVQREKPVQCFLPRVQYHFEQYLGLRDEKELANYVTSHNKELEELVIRQELHLCHLFADAFATFFLGPAYIYTLLHFHFAPDENLHSATAEMPAFTQRLVFALETLNWMHIKPQDHVKDPFAEEIIDFPEMWTEVLKSIGESDDYKTTKEAFREWLTQIHAAFESAPYSSPLAIEGTYKRWRAASILKDKLHIRMLTEIEISQEDMPNNWLFVVLNAAWSARWNKPDQLEAIESNALRILLGMVKVKTISRDEQRDEQTGSSKNQPVDRRDSDSQRQDAIDRIKNAIQRNEDFELQREFQASIDRGNWEDGELKGKIFQAVANVKDPDAERAYSILWPRKTAG